MAKKDIEIKTWTEKVKDPTTTLYEEDTSDTSTSQFLQKVQAGHAETKRRRQVTTTPKPIEPRASDIYKERYERIQREIDAKRRKAMANFEAENIELFQKEYELRVNYARAGAWEQKLKIAHIPLDLNILEIIETLVDTNEYIPITKHQEQHLLATMDILRKHGHVRFFPGSGNFELMMGFLLKHAQYRIQFNMILQPRGNEPTLGGDASRQLFLMTMKKVNGLWSVVKAK